MKEGGMEDENNINGGKQLVLRSLKIQTKQNNSGEQTLLQADMLLHSIRVKSKKIFPYP